MPRYEFVELYSNIGETYGSVLARLNALVDNSKLTSSSILMIHTAVYQTSIKGVKQFYCVSHTSTTGIVTHVDLIAATLYDDYIYRNGTLPYREEWASRPVSNTSQILFRVIY